MLRPEVTIDDIAVIVFMITLCIAMYLSYRAGKLDGYYEGCKARRQAERQVRRSLRRY